jgi:tyrosyl-DNA phosphodiesterase-1
LEQKDQISLIIMSTFVVDEEWLQGLLPPAHLVPRIIIRPHSKEHQPEFNGKLHILDNGELRCYPTMPDNWG